MLNIVFDGNNTAYRANVVTELHNKKGERTSAIVGTLNIIQHTIKHLQNLTDLPVREVIVAWDKGRSKRRTELYPEYKANRKKEQETQEDVEFKKEFIQQTNELFENLSLFGVKSVRKDGCEGDDLIYAVTKKLQELYKGDKTIIVSTDEDFHQLINEGVEIYSPIKQVWYNYANYENLTGINPEHFITYKILKGDNSDGISGIQGIGDKTARSIVEQFGGLDNILNNRDILCKSKRTARIFTQEGLSTLQRNNQLINLKDYVDTKEFEEVVNDCLSETLNLNGKLAIQFLMKHQIISILDKWKVWSRTFEEIGENNEGDKP